MWPHFFHCARGAQQRRRVWGEKRTSPRFLRRRSHPRHAPLGRPRSQPGCTSAAAAADPMESTRIVALFGRSLHKSANGQRGRALAALSDAHWGPGWPAPEAARALTHHNRRRRRRARPNVAAARLPISISSREGRTHTNGNSTLRPGDRRDPRRTKARARGLRAPTPCTSFFLFFAWNAGGWRAENILINNRNSGPLVAFQRWTGAHVAGARGGREGGARCGVANFGRGRREFLPRQRRPESLPPQHRGMATPTRPRPLGPASAPLAGLN